MKSQQKVAWRRCWWRLWLRLVVEWRPVHPFSRHHIWLSSGLFKRFEVDRSVGRIPCISWRQKACGLFPPWCRYHGTSRATPPQVSEETLYSNQIGQRRHHGVFPSLDALSRPPVDSPKRQYGVQVVVPQRAWALEALYKPLLTLLIRLLFPVGSPLTQRLLGT
jgi:hypothetical protein